MENYYLREIYLTMLKKMNEKREMYKLMNSSENVRLCCVCRGLVIGEDIYMSFNEKSDRTLYNIKFWCSECAKEFEDKKEKDPM